VVTRSLIFVVALAVSSLAARGQAALTITLADRALQPGELVVVTIAATGASAIDAVTVHAFGRDVPAFETGDGTWRAIAGLDLDTKPGPATVDVTATVDGRSVQATRDCRILTKTFPTRRLRVAPDYVNPPPDILARIQRDAALLERTWAATSPTRLWNGPFVRPVPQRANSAFGTRSIFNGEPRSPHSGADFLSPAGTPVHAPNTGRVLVAENLYFTGNTVVVDHGLGLLSLFAHLSRMDVEPDEMVATGQVLGAVGSTGRVTGPHLHWTLRAGGARVDPLSLLALLGRDAG
jgi:murein DD-endopeptidase MepM/ murein hydrolase activator NlpD